VSGKAGGKYQETLIKSTWALYDSSPQLILTSVLGFNSVELRDFLRKEKGKKSLFHSCSLREKKKREREREQDSYLTSGLKISLMKSRHTSSTHSYDEWVIANPVRRLGSYYFIC